MRVGMNLAKLKMKRQSHVFQTLKSAFTQLLAQKEEKKDSEEDDIASNSLEICGAGG